LRPSSHGPCIEAVSNASTMSFERDDTRRRATPSSSVGSPHVRCHTRSWSSTDAWRLAIRHQPCRSGGRNHERKHVHRNQRRRLKVSAAIGEREATPVKRPTPAFMTTSERNQCSTSMALHATANRCYCVKNGIVLVAPGSWAHGALEQKVGLVFILVLSHMVVWMNSATCIPQAISCCMHPCLEWLWLPRTVRRNGEVSLNNLRLGR
jgi:hypothetical protein